MFGWNGKLIRVNLTNRTIAKETLNLENAKNFLGGGGLEPR